MPVASPLTSAQVAGNSNPFLSRLLNRDTITRISYKSKSLGTGGWGVRAGVHKGPFSRGTALHTRLIFLQMMPTFFKT